MPVIAPDVARARGTVAALARAVKNGERPADDADYLAARRHLAYLSISQHITRTLAAAPPLTPDQRAKLAELLAPARRARGAR